MELLQQQAEAEKGRQNNPALETLNAWCAARCGQHKELKFMLCPFCLHQVAPDWQALYTATNELGNSLAQVQRKLTAQLPDSACAVYVILDWARCPNETCHQILVKVLRYISRFGTNYDVGEWFAVPKRKPPQPVDDLVLDPFATDFEEACLILDDSPRMSSVLSRRILADLLEKFANLTDYNVATRIDKYIADTSHPSRLRENLHYLREIGDFSAHTMKDDHGQIVNVEREEAE